MHNWRKIANAYTHAGGEGRPVKEIWLPLPGREPITPGTRLVMHQSELAPQLERRLIQNLLALFEEPELEGFDYVYGWEFAAIGQFEEDIAGLPAGCYLRLILGPKIPAFFNGQQEVSGDA